jgi:hypothetical protein
MPPTKGKKQPLALEEDPLARAQRQLEEVKVVMQSNIDKAANERQQSLERIEQKSEGLDEQAGLFYKSSEQVRREMWRKNCRQKLCVATVAAAVITILALVIWGITK